MFERRRNNQNGTLFLFLALASATLGCASPIKRSIPSPPPQNITTVLFYPVGFRWSEPVYRGFDVSEHLVQTAIQTFPDRVAFFGPSEFRVFRMEDDHAWAATSALPMMRALGIEPETVLVLRAWVEKRVALSEKEIVSSRGKKAGYEQVEDTVFVGHVEWVHPSSAQVVAELSLESPKDALTSDGGGDDAVSHATHILDKLVEEAMKTLKPFSATVNAAPLPDMAFVPTDYLKHSEEALQSLNLQLSSVDALDAEVLRQARLRYFNPHLGDRELLRLARLPGGLYVRKTREPLEEGDVLLAIDGQPATLAAFHRRGLRAAPAPAAVRKKDGSTATFPLP